MSVVIPTHDRPEWLAVALASAVAQTWEPLEILVCDDGGMPETERVVREYRSDGRVRFHRSGATGVAGNHHRALQEARGELVTFLSDDDRLAPEFVARRAALMSADPQAVVVFSGYRLCDDALRPVRDFQPPLRSDGVLEQDELLLAALGRHWSINASLFRRSSALAAWPDERAVGAAFDLALHLHLALQDGARGWFGPWCDVDYRVHEAQTSRGDALLRHFGAGDCAYSYVLASPMSPRHRRHIERDRAAWLVQWGRALAREGDIDSARRRLREAVRVAPLTLLPWRQLAVAYATPKRLGRPALSPGLPRSAD